MSEHQAEADTPDETPVADPLDAANSTDSGTTNAYDDHRKEVEAALRAMESDEQGEQPANQEAEEAQEDADHSEESEDEQQISSEDAEESEEDAEPEAKAKDRFRFKDALDQKVAAVAKAMGVSLIDAAKIVEGQNPTKHQESEPEREASESVATVTATIKDLQSQKKEKLSSLEFEAAAELDEQIDALRDQRDELKVTEAREQSRQEQAETEKFYADYAKSEEKTVGFYPDAAVKDSAMAKEMAKLDAEMRELGDPLYHSTDKPFILAKEAAKNLGIPMRKPGTTPAKKTVQHRPIQPAGGNARTTAADPARRATDAIDGITSMRDYRDMVAAL